MPLISQLTLSGAVHSSKVLFAAVGDVAIHPGSGRTPFIDATIFDGGSWRAMDLHGFGFRKSDRIFDHPEDIGSLMRQIKRKIISCKGSQVYYDSPAGSKRRKYIYRGIPFASLIQRNPWGFN